MRYFIFTILLVAGIALAQPATLSLALSDIYTVSDNCVSTDSTDYSTRTFYDYDDLIMLLNDYSGSTGLISQQYLDYFRSCLSWSTLNDHYVAFVTTYIYGNNTRYKYVIAIGDISFSGITFSGSGVDVYEFYPNSDSVNNYRNYYHTLQSSFSFTDTGGLVFTDLSSLYPDLRSRSEKYIYTILFVMALIVCFYTFTHFGWRNAKRRPILK